MTAEHHDFIFFCRAGYLADDIETHLVVLVSLGFDVERNLRAEAVLQQAHETVVVLRCNGSHRWWYRSSKILRASPGREDCSTIAVYARRQRRRSPFLNKKLVDLISHLDGRGCSCRHRRGTGGPPRTAETARPRRVRRERARLNLFCRQPM